jgi:hypothetical protein
MKFLDLTKDKKPRWINTGGLKNYPFVMICVIPSYVRYLDDKQIYSEPVQWLVDNLSTKGGRECKRYKYIHTSGRNSKFPVRCGVAFMDIDDAMAFKIAFSDICEEIER